MTDDSSEARRARAKRLRREIEELTHKPAGEEQVNAADADEQADGSNADDFPGAGEPAADQPAASESPRDFVHRRMREMDKRKHPPK